MDLIDKIKEGIIKSGFPLKMKIGSILDKNDWPYSIGSLYKDFETEKIREVDLSASKTINGVAIHLQIACKKSTDKQLVLYAPKKMKKDFFYDTYFTAMPMAWGSILGNGLSNKIAKAFSNLNLFDSTVPIAKKLIVTKGNTITEDNIKFLSDFNSIIKHSIVSGSDGYIDTGYRIVYLYTMIFDGHIYNLTPSENEDFNLTSCEYGILMYEPNLKFSQNESPAVLNDLVATSKHFKNKFIVEIMTPSYFEKYLTTIDQTLNSINKKQLKSWGEDWPSMDDLLSKK